ncbi:MAG: Tfp pilus assembly protein PilF, partial [Prochlorothrix sp.]
ERDPRNPVPYRYLGVALQGRGRSAEAMEAFQQARMLYQQAQDSQGVRQVEQLMRATVTD